MRLEAWRLVSEKWAGTAFSGEGARLAGGRWNSKGTAVVYLADSLALAALELLVHIDHHRALAGHVAFPVGFDSSLVSDLDGEDIPEEFPAVSTVSATQRIGDAWLRSASSALLRVPSAVVPREHNYLLNPEHVQMSLVSIGKPIPFRFDERLLND